MADAGRGGFEEFAGETGAAEQGEHSRTLTARIEQVRDLLELDQVAAVHASAPFGFSDRQHLAVVVQDDHVDFMASTCDGVPYHSAEYAGGLPGEGLGVGHVFGPEPAHALEYRPGDLAEEGVLGSGPYPLGPSGTDAFELGPVRAHDRVVEPHQRLGDPVFRPVLPERVRLPQEKASILQDSEMVGDVCRFALDTIGDPSPCRVAFGNGRQHGVVEARIA